MAEIIEKDCDAEADVTYATINTQDLDVLEFAGFDICMRMLEKLWAAALQVDVKFLDVWQEAETIHLRMVISGELEMLHVLQALYRAQTLEGLVALRRKQPRITHM
jgi:hypothetical protein